MPGPAKKKTAKRRGGQAKRAKSASAPVPKGMAPATKSEPGQSSGSESSKRRGTRLEIAERRDVIKRLYIVRKWPAATIAEKLRDKYDVSIETVKNDIRFIRAEFKEAKKNGEGSLDDILAGITEGKNERVRILWNEVVKIEEAEANITLRRERLNTELDMPAADVVAISRTLNECDRLTQSLSTKKRANLKELRETDDSYVDCICKLGITVDLGEDDEDEILIRIRNKRKEHDAQAVNITIGSTDGKSGNQ